MSMHTIYSIVEDNDYEAYISIVHDCDLNPDYGITLETSSKRNGQFLYNLEKNEALELANAIINFYNTHY